MIVPNPESFEAVSGQGLRAIYESHIIMIGTRKLMSESEISISENVEIKLKELENMGKTAVLVAIDSKLVGL